MGIGFQNLEASVLDIGGMGQYKGMLQHMVDQGLINTRSYSLWLDDLNATTGAILFGGYDTGKYATYLTVLEIQPDPSTGLIDAFYVPWTSLWLTNAATPTQFNLGPVNASALLDSGTTITFLPPTIYTQLATDFGAYENETAGGIFVPCDLGEGTLDFGFDGSGESVISVSFSELALSAYDFNEEPIILDSGEQACLFGLGESYSETDVVFGHTFLRSAYVIYDLDAKLIAISQSNFHMTTPSNIVEVQAGPEPFGCVQKPDR